MTLPHFSKFLFGYGIVYPSILIYFLAFIAGFLGRAIIDWELKLIYSDKDKWIFKAFKNKSDYPKKPYFKKTFYNHTELKMFSADHSLVEKIKYPDYVSTYDKK